MPDDNIYSFEAAQTHRDIAASEADQARWEDLRARLFAVMLTATADHSNRAVIAATISALLEDLQRTIDFDEAIAAITDVIGSFRTMSKLSK